MGSHLLAAGEGAHEAEDGEAGLGAGVDKADHLDGRHAVNDHLAEDVLYERKGTATVRRRADAAGTRMRTDASLIQALCISSGVETQHVMRAQDTMNNVAM